MRIKQYAYFAIYSDALTASDVTSLLRMEPDDFHVRGSQTSTPAVPRSHRWRIRCDERGLPVDDQIRRLIIRLDPYRQALVKLASDLAEQHPPGRIVLGVVRKFDDEEGEEEEDSVIVLPDGSTLERLPGQHQLLGWSLDSKMLEFVRTVGAEIDVDEYG